MIVTSLATLPGPSWITLNGRWVTQRGLDCIVLVLMMTEDLACLKRLQSGTETSSLPTDGHNHHEVTHN